MKDLIIDEIKDLIENGMFSYEYLEEFFGYKIELFTKRINNFNVKNKLFKEYSVRIKNEKFSKEKVLCGCSILIEMLLKYIKKDSCLEFYYKILEISKSEENEYTKAFNLIIELDKIFENKNNFEEREKDKKMNMNSLTEKMMANYIPSEINDDTVALNMNGLIVIKRKNGDYVRYDVEQEKIVNEMNLVLNNSSISKTILLMPTNQILKGDVIRENSTYYYVLEPKSLKCVNLSTGERNTLVDETNMITGNKIFHKVTSLFSMQANGTLNPMLLCFMNDDESDNNSDLFTMMAMSNMMGNNTNQMFQNPMMMYMMMGNDKGSSNDMLKFMMMSQMMGNNQMFNSIKGE